MSEPKPGERRPLYDIPQRSKLSLPTSAEEVMVTFHRIDGMYSFCRADETGNIYHLAALAQFVFREDGVWELAPDQLYRQRV